MSGTRAPKVRHLGLPALQPCKNCLLGVRRRDRRVTDTRQLIKLPDAAAKSRSMLLLCLRVDIRVLAVLAGERRGVPGTIYVRGDVPRRR